MSMSLTLNLLRSASVVYSHYIAAVNKSVLNCFTLNHSVLSTGY